MASLHSRRCLKENGGCAPWQAQKGKGRAGNGSAPALRPAGRGWCFPETGSRTPALPSPTAGPGLALCISGEAWGPGPLPATRVHSGLQLVPLGDGLPWAGDHVLPVLHLAGPALPGQVDLRREGRQRPALPAPRSHQGQQGPLPLPCGPALSAPPSEGSANRSDRCCSVQQSPGETEGPLTGSPKCLLKESLPACSPCPPCEGLHGPGAAHGSSETADP